jgi:hypothetical protein
LKFVLTSLVLVALAFASTQAASPATAPVVVKATIWPNLVITFSPNTFKHGTVVIKVKNGALRAHRLSINGVTTKSIEPHTIVSATVTFTRRATYTATLADCGYLSRCAGRDTPSGNVKVT